MKKIFQITWVCLLFLSFHVGAQNLYLSVKETDTNLPVSAASVHVFAPDHKKSFQTTITDNNGNIVLNQQFFPCIIEISATGFETYTQNILSYSSQPINILLNRKTAALNDVVVTGLARPMRLESAISKYRVISNATLQAQGSRNLADALSTQLNMNINTDGILGANINMQGVNGDKVKILVDGMPLNGRENGNIDLSQINLSNIDHIEIVQGPMSVVYGSDAIGGVINLITKKNLNPLELQGSFNYESVGKYSGDVALSSKVGKCGHFTIGAGANYFNGYRYDDTLIAYHGISFPYHRSLYFKPKEQEFANLSYNYIAPSGFKLQLANDFTNENITSLGAPYVFDPYNCKASDDYIHTLRNQTRVMLEGKLKNKGLWQSQNSYSLYYRTRNNYIKDLVTMEDMLNQSLSGEQDTSRYDEFNFRGTYTNKWKQFDYTAGYDIDLQDAHSQKIKKEDGSISDYAAYGNISRSFYQNKFTPQLGLRAAYNNRYAAPLIPSLNLLYKATDDIQWRASYGKGFRAPSLKELYLSFIDLNHDIIGNPNLKPELSQHFEASYSNRFYHATNSFAKLVITGYYNDVTNQIVLVSRDNNKSANKLTYANNATMRNVIVNVQTELQWKALYLQVGYAYTHMLSHDTTRSFNLNEVVMNGRYSWKKAGIDFNIFYKLTGKIPKLDYNTDGSAIYTGTTMPAFNMLDVTVEKKFWNKRIQVIAGVKNIFNVENLKPNGVAVVTSTNPHGGNNEVNFLPRRFFTTLRYTFR